MAQTASIYLLQFRKLEVPDQGASLLGSGDAISMGSRGGSEVKNPPAGQETQETWVRPWVRKIPGGGNGNPLQYYCPGNPLDRRAWWATVHGVSESQTWLCTHDALSGLDTDTFLLNLHMAGTEFLSRPFSLGR